MAARFRRAAQTQGTLGSLWYKSSISSESCASGASGDGDAIPLFPRTDFQEHYANCEAHSLLDSRDLLEACKWMDQHIVKIGEK